MAYSPKREELEKQYGKPMAELIADMVREEGSILKASIKLNIGPTTAKYWLKKAGYKITFQPQVILSKPEANGHE